jgi:hypothetical protein
MTLVEFRATISQQQPPPALPPLLDALWWDAKGDWNQAHEIAQSVDTPDAAWVHAYLHRKEDDTGNAAYWYRLARQPISKLPFDAEWEQITSALLARETSSEVTASRAPNSSRDCKQTERDR